MHRVKDDLIKVNKFYRQNKTFQRDAKKDT